MQGKAVCFTIDVEPDYGGLLNENVYSGLNYLPKLESIVSKHGIKITAFITGKTLEDNPDLVRSLLSMNAEMEQHSYQHQVGHGSKSDDILKGIETHRRILGKNPIGYRSPQGIITKESLQLLESQGILYDSSIFPTYFPGRFNRLRFPTSPFRIKNSSLLEIPFSVVPYLKIPIGLSYIHLLGLSFFKTMLKLLGYPKLIIFDFHTYELGRVETYTKLPLVPRIGYLRSQRLYRDPADVLEKFVSFLLVSGYESKFMWEVYEEIKESSFVWDWTGD